MHSFEEPNKCQELRRRKCVWGGRWGIDKNRMSFSRTSSQDLAFRSLPQTHKIYIYHGIWHNILMQQILFSWKWDIFLRYVNILSKFSSVQSLSRVWLFVTPWTAAHQASLSITNSRSPPRPMSIESVMPSNYLIFCCPLLLPSIFPSIRVFSNESALCIRWPKYWSFSFKHQSLQWTPRTDLP